MWVSFVIAWFSGPSTTTNETRSCAMPVVSVSTPSLTTPWQPAPAVRWIRLRTKRTGRRLVQHNPLHETVDGDMARVFLALRISRKILLSLNNRCVLMRQELQKRQVAVKMRILLNRNVTEIYVNCGHLPITYRLHTDHLQTTYRPPTDRFSYGAACSILPKCSLAKVWNY